MSLEHRNIGVEERIIEKKSDSSKVATTLIKYLTYLIIFFGIMYFVVEYVVPRV